VVGEGGGEGAGGDGSAEAAGAVGGAGDLEPRQGYGDDLLAEITHQLVELGAEQIRFDTDLTNKPMAASFDRAGYRNIAVRIVASHPIEPGRAKSLDGGPALP
jgi:hypothetical protein